jgi:hypothetical protein
LAFAVAPSTRAAVSFVIRGHACIGEQQASNKEKAFDLGLEEEKPKERMNIAGSQASYFRNIYR